MYTIYSVGDVQYLARVFDGVSMLTGSGSLVGASAIACLIGVIFLCFQSVINTQGIKIQNVLVCFVIYLVCFAVPTQVNIVSSNDDSNFAQRDNVPLGIAMIGSTISTITHELTEKMEIAMTPVLTDSTVIASKNGGGYANSLYLLNHVTRPQTGYAVQLVDSKSPGFINNLNSYAAECTVIKYILGGKNTPKDFSQLATKNFIDAVTFDSEVYFTSLTDPQTGSIEDYSCREGMAKIKSWWNDSLKNLTEAESASLAKELLGASSNSGDFTSYNEIVNRISAKTAEMAGMGYAAADRGLPQLSTAMVQELIFANATRDVVMRGVAQGYTSFSDTNSSYMLTQAMLQRNSQWAAESSMFLNSVPAIMAFIEGFFYAITPFASILILLGLFGLNIFVKYIILLLWVQLWTPVMAIINMYIMHGAALDIFKIPAQLTGQDSSVSLYMNDSIAQVTENWISVGSMFMAATPLLTFIILTGSAYALTSLTGRMNGADVINEKMITPDLIQPGAGLAMSSVYTGNMNSTIKSGMEKLLQSFNIADSIKATASYANSRAVASADAFANKWRAEIGTIGGTAGQKIDQAITADAKSGTNARLNSYMDGYGKDIVNGLTRELGLTDSQKSALSAAIMAQAEIGVGVNYGVGKAGISLQNSEKWEAAIETALNLKKGIVHNALQKATEGYNEQHSAEFAIAATDSLNKADSFGISLSESGSIIDGVTKDRNTTVSEQEQAQKIGAIDRAISQQASYNPVDIIGSLSRTAEGRQALQQIDQMYTEMYNAADSNQRAVFDANMNTCSGLTGDARQDQSVAKLTSLLNADMGKQGDLSDDISRRATVMQLATTGMPGTLVSNTTSQVGEDPRVVKAEALEQMPKPVGYNAGQANVVTSKAGTMIQNAKNSTPSGFSTVEAIYNNNNHAENFAEESLSKNQKNHLEKVKKTPEFSALINANDTTSTLGVLDKNGQHIAKATVEYSVQADVAEAFRALQSDPENLVEAVNNKSIFNDTSTDKANRKAFYQNLEEDKNGLDKVLSTITFGFGSTAIDEGQTISYGAQNANDLVMPEAKDFGKKTSDASLLRAVDLKDNNGIGNFAADFYIETVNDQKAAKDLIDENRQVKSNFDRVGIFKDPRIHIDPKINENAKNEAVKSYNSYQSKVENLTSKYSDYKSFIDNKTEDLKSLIQDRYYVSKDEASIIASKIINSILDLSRTSTNKTELYSRKLNALQKHLSSLAELKK